METAPVRASMELDADSTGGRLLTDVAWWTGERASFEVATPVTWDRDHPIPETGEGDVMVLAAFDSAPLGPFVTWLPQIAFAHGYLTGNFEARGPLDDLDMRGELGIHDGYVELVGLGQHLHDVSGDLEFRGNWARLHQLRARDGDGSIRVDGSIGFDGWFPARARVALNSDEFPVRSEGSVLATLSGGAGIEADISGDETQMDIEVRNLNVQLPDDSTRSVQDLEAHPDIRIVGVASQSLAEEEPYPFRIHVDAARPFWVRRSDFAAMVVADLVATYRDPDLYLAGYAELRRGFFEVFGKRFEIERGSMNFDGESDIDPEVNLVAIHDMRTPPNTQVTVIVSGQLSNPTIEFSSNHRDCDERAEIISMLVSGRCGAPSGDTSNLEFNAYEQASDFLAGIAAGLLTLTARKEFGDVLPVIVIESGNQAFQSARVRAGFQANDIIPDFLDDVVQGAYIEGIFTAGSQNSDQAASLLPGVLIELSFPYSLVTTGEYTPPNNWSVDITWEP
jgi:translocation and assembly module TamB